MADVGTVCDTWRSCSVIEDDGLSSAFTTAHELGHVFNMPHDSVKACEETFGKQKENHMMSPTLIKINSSRPWSACSAAIITDFLDSGHGLCAPSVGHAQHAQPRPQPCTHLLPHQGGDCLLDLPVKPLVLPEPLPGVSYSVARQCELAFGAGSRPCPFVQSCTRLWCTGRAGTQLVCQTRHFAWADGTSCGDGRLCLHGVCTNSKDASSAQVDGRWGGWSAFGPCSRTCGGGIQVSKRSCDTPVPAHGGDYCQGTRVKYRSCNLQPCPDSGRSFREEQCEARNSISLNTNWVMTSVTWVPKYSGVSSRDRCKLICRANGTGYFYILAQKVVDGTPCSPDSPAVCVQGRCIKAGCDGKLFSSKRLDNCGTCGGDGQGCRKVSGLFTKPTEGYNFVVTLPMGATNIDVRQRGYRGLLNDDNYLALRDSSGLYLLNGNYVVTAVERDVMTRGVLLRYSGTSREAETLRTRGPLREPLTVEVLSVGKMTPPRVRYSFYLPKESKEEKMLRKEGKSLAHNNVLPGGHKGAPPSSPHKHIPLTWSAGAWEPCSVSCGSGLQKRLVLCLDLDGRSVTAGACEPARRPSALRTCSEPCPAWDVGGWSPCSRSCGKGFMRRALHCVSGSGHLLPREQCASRTKPQELDFCSLQPC